MIKGSRKAMRKNKRLEKKARKHSHWQVTHQRIRPIQQEPQHSEQEIEQSPQSDPKPSTNSQFDPKSYAGIDDEIQYYEKKLKLHSKNKDKHYEKLFKYLEKDGFGRDFYDSLEKGITDQTSSVEPLPEQEITFAEPESPVAEIITKKQKTATKEIVKPSQLVASPDCSRRLTSILNKLSDQNIEPLTNQLVELYKSESNSVLNEGLWTFLLSTFNREDMPQQLLAAYTACIAGLSRFIGREILAFVMSKLYSKLDELNKSMASLWAYLYIFGAIGVPIVSGLLKHLCSQGKEDSIGSLILIINLVGFRLRKDEPLLIKELISLASQSQIGNTGRGRFMLEVLEDIKNNKKKVSSMDGSLSFLKGWLKNTVQSKTGIKESSISITWADLGNKKWRQLLQPSFLPSSQASRSYSSELETLAARQHMNTGPKKEIFCLLMSSEDYMDAFSKISRLKKQEKEVVRVLMTACGQESTFNEFYSLIGVQLCKHKGSYAYSFQYALWDNIKQFQEFSIRKIANIAKMMSNMIGERVLPLGILKFIEFHAMNDQVSMFLRILIGDLVGNQDGKVLSQVFRKARQNSGLAAFTEGLRMYLRVTLQQSTNQTLLNRIGAEQYHSRVELIIAELYETDQLMR